MDFAKSFPAILSSRRRSDDTEVKQMNTSRNAIRAAAGPETPAPATKPRSRIGAIALALALLGLFAAVVSGWGYRLGLWTYQDGFVVLLSAAVVAVVGAAFALVGIYQTRPRGKRRGMAWALAALALGAATASVPLSLLWITRHLPPVRDISIATDRPLDFISILPLRAGATDPSPYGGTAVAALVTARPSGSGSSTTWWCTSVSGGFARFERADCPGS